MNEPKPKGDLIDAPEWFNDELRAGWEYALSHAPRGLLKRIDSSVLTIWVTAENLYREASLRVAETGTVIKTENGNPIQNPYLSIMNKQAAIMLKVASELGFSPAARPRLSIESYHFDDDSSEYDEFRVTRRY